MSQAKNSMTPPLSRGDLLGDVWSLASSALLARWPRTLATESHGEDLVRHTGTFTLGPDKLICAVTWTFTEGALATLSLKPEGGRGELNELLLVIGVSPSSLEPVGDGLFSVQTGRTRFDVDRLDSVISVHEVCG